MEDDGIAAENAALKRKLQSKAEALLILSRELTNCRRERDHFRDFFEKTQSSKEKEYHLGIKEAYNPEIDELKTKLKSVQSELIDLKKEKRCESGVVWHQREELIQELEETKSRAKELASDLQALLDEKEELITERDAYRCKVHRLNHEISVLLKSDQTIDIDALIMENKYLKERFDQSLAEKESTQQTLSKYKAMLDKKKMKGAVKLGANSACGGLVVTHKQVQELLEKDFSFWKTSQNVESAMGDLRSLSLALLESLQDKSLAVNHLRKTNKILAERVNDLEKELSKQIPVFPSQALLEGHSNAQFDKNLNNDIVKEFKENHQNAVSEPEIKEEEKETDDLPPELQELVRKAMEEMSTD